MGAYTYLRVLAEHTAGEHGRIADELAFRKAIQDALARSFGVSGAGTYVDVLRFRAGTINSPPAKMDSWAHADDRGRTVEDAVIRVARG